jgi:hypothetical protein
MCFSYPQDYRQWKQEKQEEWSKIGTTTLSDQKQSLLRGIDYALSNLDRNIFPALYRNEALHSYNFLCELLNLPAIDSVNTLDKNLLNEVEAHIYKEEKQEEWDHSGKTNFTEKLASLLSTIYAHNGKPALSAYNLLREFLNKPRVASIPEIDNDWIDEVKTANDYYSDAKSNNLYPATDWQLELARQAQRIIGLTKKIQVFATNENHSHTNGNHIALELTPDLDHLLYVIYHELGHIIHQDNIYYGTDRFSDPHYKADIDKIAEYIEKGKKLFNDTTTLGKYIISVLKENPSFWIPPTAPEIYQEYLNKRSDEQRADLFAMEQLFKQNQRDPLLRIIEKFGASRHITIQGTEDVHSSHFEMALYFAGFLATQGIDVNKALKAREDAGMCFDSEAFGQSPNSIGYKDFKEVYEEDEEKQLIKLYDDWKTKKLEAWQVSEIDSPYKKTEDLLYSLNKTQEELTHWPVRPDLREQLLFIYNLLREISDERINLSHKDIDRNWIEKVTAEHKYKQWQKSLEKLLNTLKKTTRAQKIQHLIDEINYFLSRAYEIKQGSLVLKDALYSYRHLRELYKLPAVKSLTEIDKNWLAAIDIQTWKKEKHEAWAQAGIKTKPQQINALRATIQNMLKLLVNDPNHSRRKKNALYSYNLLREMLKQQPIKSFEEIDKKWLAAIGKHQDKPQPAKTKTKQAKPKSQATAAPKKAKRKKNK